MRHSDPQISRVLETLSRLMDRNLDLVESSTEARNVVVARGLQGHAPVAVHDSSGGEFSEKERCFLQEIAELLARDGTLRSENVALDHRMKMLEREITEMHARNRALAEASSRDSLTGLYNRWYIVDKIEAEMNRALRHGSPMSVLMIDIDHFKTVNDSFGHSAGDTVLQAMGQVLRESCRVYDIPGRYGGEEFCLLLPETKIDKTMPVAERIRRKVASTPFLCGQTPVHVTASVGVAGLENVPDEGLYGASSLIERADRALYAAKNGGRNRVETWNVDLTHKQIRVEH